MPQPTEQQLQNFTRAISKDVQEDVRIEYIDGCYFIYGSELACLRLEHQYNNRPKAQAGYSRNLNTWYFKLET